MRALPDINIWLALSRSGHVHHEPVHAWLSAMTEAGVVLFCRATQQGYVRLLTTEVVMRAYGGKALTNQQAWDLQHAWYRDDRVGQASEPAGIEARWKEFGAIRSASPKLWMDAYLAAFAMAGGFRLVTTDKAFKQFKGLDPLVIG
jgi:toxin-antitoxin system PIN domain toxin